MITAIREVRKAKGLTLAEVGARCTPPTTAQTIGRLETGTRTVSVGWLNRIAKALEVEAADLVSMPEQAELPVAALLSGNGATAPTQSRRLTPPAVRAGQIGVMVTSAVGEYRSGDQIWCDRLAPGDFSQAMNRDILVPRPAGRFLYGRLIGHDGEKLHVLPLEAGARQLVVTDPPWIAMATALVRGL